MNITQPRGKTNIGAALTQQMAAGQRQQRDHRQHGEQGGLQRRQPQPQQRADAAGAGNAADAEETVKTGHHRLAAGAFDDHRLHVHRYVDHADRRAEQQQRRGHAAEGVHQRQQRQIDAQPEPGHQDHRTATQFAGQETGQRHRQHGAGADTEQQQAERAVIDTDARFGEGDQRRPGGHAETGDEKGQTGGDLLRNAGRLLFIAQGGCHVSVRILGQKNGESY